MIGKLLRALGVVVSLTGTLGAEPFRPGDRYLSKTQLAEQGPIKVRIDEKRAFLDDKLARGVRLFFTHDPECALAEPTRDANGRYATCAPLVELSALQLH